MDGKIWSIAKSRSVVLDVVRQAAKVPSFPVERIVDLSELADLRRQATERISWTAIFTRAYGLASREHPCLRQIYVSWPWPRVYQASECIISIAVNRQTEHGEQLFFGRVHSPELRSLRDIQADLDQLQSGDPRQVFRTQVRAAKVPTLLRRLGWWWRMSVDYKNRARRCGTGSISTLAGLAVTNRLHPCILTSSLSFSHVDDSGQCLVTLQCDHRVIDGVPAARALNSLCDHLTQTIRAELPQNSHLTAA